MRRPARVITVLASLAFVVGAGSGTSAPSREGAQLPQLQTTVQAETVQPAPVRGEAPAQVKPVSEEPLTSRPETGQLPAASAAAYQINWSSINSGGAIQAASTNYRMGLSVGQSVAGAAASTNYTAGIGFWYGASAGPAACAVVATGDVNVNGTITSSDIIYEVNFVFKGGAAPLPCEAAGDVNCNGAVTSSDIITLVNYVFKGGPPPCDVCTLIPATWSCP